MTYIISDIHGEYGYLLDWDKVKIYCKASSKPKGWSTRWAGKNFGYLGV